jgi:hypothetical protein
MNHLICHADSIRFSSLRNEAIDSPSEARKIAGFCKLLKHETLSKNKVGDLSFSKTNVSP